METVRFLFKSKWFDNQKASIGDAAVFAAVSSINTNKQAPSSQASGGRRGRASEQAECHGVPGRWLCAGNKAAVNSHQAAQSKLKGTL